MSMTTKESLISLLKTASISGPFIDAGHVTAKPTKKFLQGIRDPRLRYLEVPRNLLWAFGDRDDGGEVDPLAFYLCIALARHFSYFKMYGVLYHTNILNSSDITLYDLYKDFRVSFGVTCGVLKDMAQTDNMSPTDVTWGVEELKQLIELERMLTHQTFELLPVLFVKTMATDAKLLETLTGMSTKDRTRQASDPKVLLETVQTRLKNEWIPLGDAEDVLDGSWEIYHDWQCLKKAKGELEEHCCNLQKAFAGSQDYAVAADGFRIWIDPCDRWGAFDNVLDE